MGWPWPLALDGRAAGVQRARKIRVQNRNVKPTTCESGRISPGKTPDDACLLLLLLFKCSLEENSPQVTITFISWCQVKQLSIKQYILKLKRKTLFWKNINIQPKPVFLFVLIFFIAFLLHLKDTFMISSWYFTSEVMVMP